MGNKCSICYGHKQRQAIDKALIAGEALRGIARQYNASQATISRHKKHIKIKIQKAQEKQTKQIVKTNNEILEKEPLNANFLINRIRAILVINMQVILQANEEKDNRMVIQATNSTLKCIDSLKTFLPAEPQNINLNVKSEEIIREEIDELSKSQIETILHERI